MSKHTDALTETRTCFACGAQRPRRDMHPFGYHGDTVASWTCNDCTAAMHQPIPTAPRRDETAVLA